MAGSTVVLMVDKMEKEAAKREKKGREEVIQEGPSASSPPARTSEESEEFLRRRTSSRPSITKAKSRFFEMNHPVDNTTILMRTATKQGSPATIPARDAARSSQSPPKSVAAEAYKSEVVAKEKHNTFSIRAVVEWTAFVLIMGCFVCSLTITRLKKLRIWDLELWKWSLMMLVVFSGRLVTG